MPQIVPIHAVRYAAASDDSNAQGGGEGGGVNDVSSLIAPPYDVLDEQPKQRLLANDPHNIVAVDLPVTPPKTVGPDEAYESAGRMFREWIARGVLKRDAFPAVFAYEQVYRVGGKARRRRGLFTALQLEEFGRHGGGIHRHERTIRAGTDDRLKLMEATAAQLSPIFGVYSDPEGKISTLLDAHFDGREPDFHGVTAADRVDHRCWIIRDSEAIDGLRAALEQTDVFIADGHHRYTTALNYSKQHADTPAAQGCLFVLVPTQDPGLQVLPTHRVLCGLSGFSIQKLTQIIETDGRFTITMTHHGADGTPEMAGDLSEHGHHAVGLYDPTGGKTYAVASKGEDPLAELMPDKAAVWRTLDVAVFHELFVDRILRPHFGGDEISYKYPHELPELIAQCHAEEGRLGAIMQPTPLDAVCEVALAGEVMPPKSTFFFPKLATGMVINPLD